MQEYIALICTTVCLFSTAVQISLHFLNYNCPNLQLLICRIIGMVPIYAIQSYLTILYPEKSLALSAVKDCYEAYVLYLFTQLIIEYLGGEYDLICLLITKKYIKRPWPMNGMKPIYLGEGFYRNVKQGVLQFVLIRPMISVLALILAGWDIYEEGNFAYNSGYLYCSIISNVSVSISLYYLVLLYTITKDHLDSSVFYKFLCVKSLIFFSFWQSCGFGLLIETGIFGEGPPAAIKSIILQNFLICIELAASSYFIWNSFNYKEFTVKPRREYSVIKSVGDMLNVKDIIDDAHNTFSTTEKHFGYADYSWDD